MTKKIILFCLLLIGLASFAQTGVTVTYYDGTTQGFNVTAAGKLYFEQDNLLVKIEASSVPTTIPVSIIRKIAFSNSLATETFGQNKSNVVLYPNPASDAIKIKADNFDTLETKIYSLSGQLVLKGNFQSGQDIDVSALTSGLYLVQVNGITIKFSKK
ncbi:T9SS type A sorting domain-containing protein [Flavobacterium sp.]|uniref:T9SS type A sorting domain-containing protein n=1 Tax=Flavobacterium sp. TaxID=239 RepID=UPI0011F850AA|nr:T9SS type A sorting domain-containing protein [Flavobacterium sp.]RZJ69069.1 MAG: T9SS type A sorting domain-containing protein [Flavobacterium sp.]